MFHGSNASPLKERLLRGMAFFFLILTVADVAFPPCFAASEVAPNAQRLTVQGISGGVTDHTKTVGTNDSRSDQPSERGCCDEDCCFACAHALSPIAVTEMAVLEIKSSSITQAGQFMPEPPLRSTYHPPRFV